MTREKVLILYRLKKKSREHKAVSREMVKSGIRNRFTGVGEAGKGALLAS